MSKVHQYKATCSWSGETGSGYEKYVRAHRAWSPPAEQQLALSADPAYRGNLALLNPEQLVVMAAASCQLLSFLADAARAGFDVRKYEDNAEGFMPTDQDPIRITSIRLHPRIEIVAGPTEARIRELVHQAHEECYIANSLTTEVTVEPTIVFV
jgi:organic hydroperoxide reductase OsmC/OhrA